MLGFEYRWFLLHPLLRGLAISLGIAALAVACLATRPSLPASPADPLPLVAAAATDDAQAAAWPHAALRLWFVLPPLLPLGSR